MRVGTRGTRGNSRKILIYGLPELPGLPFPHSLLPQFQLLKKYWIYQPGSSWKPGFRLLISFKFSVVYLDTLHIERLYRPITYYL